MKKILMIVTSHATLGETGKATGLYLPELVHPYKVLREAHFQIEVASPQGGRAPIDPESLTQELQVYRFLTRRTRTLASIAPEEHDAYFIVGGHGTMWDLPDDPDLARLLVNAKERGKVMAAVCHGPAALVHASMPDGHFLIEGARLTGFSNAEEEAVGLSSTMPFLLEDALKQAGAEYSCAAPWQAHVVVDQSLVTGQNPASARGVAEAVRDLLVEGGE